MFPYFGSKRQAASKVWEVLGTPECYLEPFGGSLAVLLNRPDPPMAEVVCDLDGLLVNFWRAIKHDWQAVSEHVGGPVSEIEIRAAHARLLSQRDTLTVKLGDDDSYYDAELAALWWQGISSWLGSGWGWRNARQRPHIDRTLKGCYAAGMTDERMAQVSARLSNVVVLSGDWKQAWQRVATSAILNRFSTISVFLDPPYAGNRSKGLYAEDLALNAEVTAWCQSVPRHVAVVLAGYADEYALPWPTLEWKPPNGYAQDGNERRHSEVLFYKAAGEHYRYFRRRSVSVNDSEP